jgi:hypothetical protein
MQGHFGEGGGYFHHSFPSRFNTNMPLVSRPPAPLARTIFRKDVNILIIVPALAPSADRARPAAHHRRN